MRVSRVAIAAGAFVLFAAASAQATHLSQGGSHPNTETWTWTKGGTSQTGHHGNTWTNSSGGSHLHGGHVRKGRNPPK